MNVNLVETFDEATAFMHWLGERRPILAIDTETGGLDWWRDALRLVQIGDGETGWAIPFHLWGGLAIDAIGRYTADVVMHNAKFDTRYLEVNGTKFSSFTGINDTRIMAHLIDPSKPTHLKGLAVDWLGSNSDEWQTELHKAMTKNQWTWATVPYDFPPYWEYACMDTILTARLFTKLAPRLTGKLVDVYDLELHVQQIIDRMERYGVKIDKDYCRVQRFQLEGYISQAEDYCKKAYGFGPGQNTAVASQLHKDGVQLTKLTPGGNFSVDESVLSKIDHPLAQLVLGVRKAGKYANAYFGNYLDMADGDLLHPDVNTLGARTGRMSISRPALQQIPRAALLRNAFIPRDGNRLVSVDYDQIEMRLFTHYCQDPALIRAFGRNGDFFLNAASDIYQQSITDKKDPRRQLTKNASYAKIYGAGPAKFALTANVSEPEARAFLGQYDATFPGVLAFQKNLEVLAKQRLHDEGGAYVNTAIGRREPAEADEIYKLVNYLVQGSAADVFKQALVELDRYGMTANLVLPVHDEVVFDVPKNEAVEFGNTVANIMRREDFVVPLTTSADVLEKWGSKYE